MLRKMLLRPSLQSLKKFWSPLANFTTLFQILQKNFPLDRGHTLNVNKTLRRRPVQNVVWTSVSSICVMCPRELKHIYEALRSGLKKIREAVSFLMKYFIRTWRQLFPENKRNKLFKFSFSRKVPSFIYSILYCVEIAQIRSYFSSVFSCIQSEYRNIRTGNNSVFGHFPRNAYLRYRLDFPFLINAQTFWIKFKFTKI